MAQRRVRLTNEISAVDTQPPWLANVGQSVPFLSDTSRKSLGGCGVSVNGPRGASGPRKERRIRSDGTALQALGV
jgi:hypothetical protein